MIEPFIFWTVVVSSVVRSVVQWMSGWSSNGRPIGRSVGLCRSIDRTVQSIERSSVCRSVVPAAVQPLLLSRSVGPVGSRWRILGGRASSLPPSGWEVVRGPRAAGYSCNLSACAARDFLFILFLFYIYFLFIFIIILHTHVNEYARNNFKALPH